MNEDKLRSSGHVTARTIFRVAGPALALLGVLLIAVGMISFFASFGSFAPPRYFWCAFLGIPLLFVGAVLSQMGYLGAVQRYIAGESAPVAKDVVNYLGENVQPGVKAVAKALTEGVLEAQAEHEKP